MGFQKYPDPKDPDSEIDYGRAWGDIENSAGDIENGWLDKETDPADPEIITLSQWLISSDAEDTPTLTELSSGFDDNNASIWLSGGTHGIKYNLTNRITTNKGRKEDRTGLLTCKEK